MITAIGLATFYIARASYNIFYIEDYFRFFQILALVTFIFDFMLIGFIFKKRKATLGLLKEATMGANNRSNTEAELRLIAYAGNRLTLHERKDKEVGTYILAAAFLIGSLSMLAASYQPVRIYSVAIVPRQDSQKRQFRQDVFRTMNLLDENVQMGVRSPNLDIRTGNTSSSIRTAAPSVRIERMHQVFVIDKNYFLAAAALALIGLLFMLRTYADVFRIVRTQDLFEKELNNITQE